MWKVSCDDLQIGLMGNPVDTTSSQNTVTVAIIVSPLQDDLISNFLMKARIKHINLYPQQLTTYPHIVYTECFFVFI